MSKTKVNISHNDLLKRWCSDCEYKNLTQLHDPCHNCMEDEFVDDVPKYYKEESKRNRN